MDYQLYDTAGQAVPGILATIPDPPKQLYWAGGSLDRLLDRPRVAIVGSRRISAYGRRVTARLAEELARHGVVIISGLALGVDAVAHRGALDAGGATIAVMPCSLEKLYPAYNTKLGQNIYQAGGTLVSEYGPESLFTYKYNFVARNRLIAGLADAVLITEAAEKSGSLHTAQFALEQGREVLVVPGNIDSPTSAGTNNLLKIGATPVTNVDDILRAIKAETQTMARPSRQSSTPNEQVVLDLLDTGLHDGESLLEHSNLPTAEFNRTLTMLEIHGLIRATGNNTWA